MNMIEKRKQMAGQGGFTLIELLVVIAILAVLAGAAIVGIGAMRDNASKTACRSDLDTVSTAAEAYRIDTDTEAANTAALVGDGYLKKVDDGDFVLTWAGSEVTVTADAGGKYGDYAPDCT